MFKCEVCEKVLSNKGGLVTHQKTCEKVFHLKDEIKKLYVDELWSIREIAKKFGLGSTTIVDVLGEENEVLVKELLLLIRNILNHSNIVKILKKL